MKIQQVTLLVFISFIALACTFFQTPKAEVEQRIRDWQQAHELVYSLGVTGTEASTTITRYHPDNPEEKNDLIRVTWRGMKITLAFKQPITELNWNTTSFQEALNYVVIDDIYHDISVSGWKIFPETPQSSTSKGVKFTEVADGKLAFTLDWEVFTVSGYSQTNECTAEMEIADSSLPETCYVGVRKTIPFHLTVDVLLEKAQD